LYEKSPRYIDRYQAGEILGRVQPATVSSVAVMVNPDPSFLNEVKSCGFDFFQIHFQSNIETSKVEEWSDIVGPERLWLVPRISAEQRFPTKLLPCANTILLDAYDEEKHGGTGKTSDWKRFCEWKKEHPGKNWILAGGIGPENLKRALVETSPNGIDLNSGVESTPGVKCREKISQVFSILNH
jgi:phosphoribosylanthranilate isomerase